MKTDSISAQKDKVNRIVGRKYRLAYFVSHPIQYQAPLLRKIANTEDIDLTVFFLSDFSLHAYKDPGFGTSIEWDVPLLEGYDYHILPSIGHRNKVDTLRPFSTGVFRQIRDGKFDAVWLHGYSHPVHLRAFIAAKLCNAKVFLRAESQLGSVNGTRTGSSMRERVIRALFRYADAFLTIGSHNSEYYTHYGVAKSRQFLVPYAVDNDFFQKQIHAASKNRESLRSSLGLEKNRPIILFASKFSVRKRAMDVLHAYALLSPDKNGFLPYLLFAGDGEERGRLEAESKRLGCNGVRFLGFQNQMALPALYNLCDIFTLVSEREPWGLVINEVMNAGKPIVISDQVGAGRDLIDDGKSGYIVPVGDITTLSHRLQYLVDHPSVRQKMGEQAAHTVATWSYEEDIAGLRKALEFVNNFQ